MNYVYWLWVFRFALWLEARAVHLRDLAQRRKMALISPLPEDWHTMRSW